MTFQNKKPGSERRYEYVLANRCTEDPFIVKIIANFVTSRHCIMNVLIMSTSLLDGGQHIVLLMSTLHVVSVSVDIKPITMGTFAQFFGKTCFYSCGLSTATIEYSCLSVCLSVLVSVCLRVCLSVYTITQKIMVQLT